MLFPQLEDHDFSPLDCLILFTNILFKICTPIFLTGTGW